MCGVIGIFDWGPEAVDQLTPAITMAHVIRHRGPNDEGFVAFGDDLLPQIFWSDDTPLNVQTAYPEARNARAVRVKSRVLLGHRRLSILDTSPSGHQPMQTQDGRYWIAFNGEIYNYIELRTELVALGYRFRTESDTEVVLAAYAEWGQGCANRFNGDWAILLFDNLQQRLFVSRDRFGIKPLYYYQDSTGLIFASEIKALLANPRVLSEPDLDVLRDYVRKGAQEWEECTAFKNIRRFPFAHSAVIDFSKPESWRTEQYFKLSVNTSNERFDPLKAEAYAKEYLALLTDAVKVRLRSDVPIGCALSGGLDSSSIVYLANELLHRDGTSEKLSTFSLVHLSPETKHCDESFYIDLLQEKLGFNSYRCEPSVSEIPKLLKEVLRHWESPPDGLGIAGIVTVGLAKNAGLTVTLDGQGADEVQAGYEGYLVNCLGNLSWLDFLSEFRSFQKNYRGMHSRRIKISLAAVGLKIFGEKWIDRFVSIIDKNRNFKFNSLNKSLLDSVNHGLVNLIHYADSRSMYYSIESRMPFMDHRLVEFSLMVPACYKFHNGYSKYFARLAFNDKLPDEITWRKDKMGWPVPLTQWFNGPLSTWAKSMIQESTLVSTLNNKVNGTINGQSPLRTRLLNIAIWELVFWGKPPVKSASKSL